MWRGDEYALLCLSREITLRFPADQSQDHHRKMVQERIDEGGPKYCVVHNSEEVEKTIYESHLGKRVRVQDGTSRLVNLPRCYRTEISRLRDFKRWTDHALSQ